MKKTLFVVLLTSIFLQNCSVSDDEPLQSIESEQANFPQQSEAFGKAVASEIRGMVANLNKKGVDYSKATRSASFKAKFYNDIKNASPTATKNRSTISEIQVASKDVVKKARSILSPIQSKFVERIIKECKTAKTEADFEKKIIELNNDIYAKVPKIEQERLFNVTAVFYYGMKEIRSLEKKGIMIPTKQSSKKSYTARINSGGETGSDGSGGSCSQFLATGWAIAVGEPTPAGEIVMSIATVIVGGVMLYEIVTCKPSPSESICGYAYSECMEDVRNPQSLCYSCFEQCQGRGYWVCAGEW